MRGHGSRLKEDNERATQRHRWAKSLDQTLKKGTKDTGVLLT